MNTGDCIIIAILLIAAGWALYACLRRKGCSGCPGGCSGGCGCSKCPGKK